MKSLYKALDILEVFINNMNSELRLTDICENTGLNKSSANRIIAILIERGYVTQREKRGKYTLSTKFLDATNQINQHKKLKEIAAPYLIKLSHLVNETIVLSIPDKKYGLVIDSINLKSALTTNVDVGAKIPLYCTGDGKLFMANMPESELNEYLAETEFHKYTVNTITDRNHLKAALKMIREEGVAYDEEEQHLGLKNVSVGVFDRNNNLIAAVGVVGPAVRLTRDRITEIIPDLKKCAASISEAIK